MVSKYSIQISKVAQIDLEEIYQYITDRSKSTKIGLMVVKEMKKAILSLESFPKRNQVVHSYPNLRRIPVYSYSITYQIDEENKKVHIVRILSDYTNWNN